MFMVPVGRENEYAFCSAGGLSELAHQAACRRLIAVCCNRPHAFPNMQELQAELSPIVLNLRIIQNVDANEPIPFMVSPKIRIINSYFDAYCKRRSGFENTFNLC